MDGLSGLSIAASVIAIARLAFSATAVYQTISGIHDVTQSLNAEAKTLSRTIQSLKQELDSNAALSEAQNSNLREIIQACCDTCDEFTGKLDKLTRPSEDNYTSCWGRVKLRFQKKKIEAFQDRLDSYKSTLDIALHTSNFKIASQILNAIKALADQMQSLQTGLRTFLDDSAENLQPVIEVENQVNGQSRNASQTRLVSRGPEDNETQPEDPPSRRRSDWSMSYPVPPRQPLSPSQIINARSSLGVPGEDYKDRVAISLCPLGQHVGYLFSDRIIVGELHAEPYAEPNSEPYAEPSAPRWTVVSRFRCSLDPRYQWKDLQLAGPYLVAWGFSQSEGRSFKVCNFKSQDDFPAPVQVLGSNLPGVAISLNGVVAYNCGSTIVVDFLQPSRKTVILNATKLDQFTSYRFSHTAFDHSENFLYAWGYGRGAHHAHEAYVWSVDCVRQECVPKHLERYPSNQFSDYNCSLLPCQAEGCVVFNSKGMEFFPLQLSGGSDPHDIPNKHTTRLSEVMTACVYRNDSLIVVRKHGLVKYPFRQGQGNTRRIDQNGEILEVKNSKISASKKSKMAVVSNDTWMVVIICTWDLKIYVIAFSA